MATGSAAFIACPRAQPQLVCAASPTASGHLTLTKNADIAAGCLATGHSSILAFASFLHRFARGNAERTIRVRAIARDARNYMGFSMRPESPFSGRGFLTPANVSSFVFAANMGRYDPANCLSSTWMPPSSSCNTSIQCQRKH